MAPHYVYYKLSCVDHYTFMVHFLIFHLWSIANAVWCFRSWLWASPCLKLSKFCFQVLILISCKCLHFPTFVAQIYLFISSLSCLCDFCSQLLPTAPTGFWPPTTPASPLCTLAQTSSACSMSTTPGSSAGRASCLQTPCGTPKSCWSVRESTCSGWRPQIRSAARMTRDSWRLQLIAL